MYDWANSAYSTLSITVLALYLTDVLSKGPGGLVYGWGLGCTQLVAAVLSPITGAMADARANKRTWLAWTTFTGAGASALMFFATPDRPALLVILFLIANLSMELSQGFYNAFLPEIADDERMGRVSAWGYALGYLGGGLALLLVMLLFIYGEALGIPAKGDLVRRVALLIMGLWWGLFSLPTLLFIRDQGPPRHGADSFRASARQALREVRGTLRNVRSYRMLALFLLGFLIYNDGVQTVISQASIFAKSVLDMGDAALIQVILMIQFVALPGAILVGWIADRVGQKNTLMACLAVWVALLAGAFYLRTPAQFWWMAAVAALVLGGTQSVSRTIMGLMTPARHSAEFFGFFNLSGKATSMFGPIFFSTILYATGNANYALGSLLIFFLLGWAIIMPLDVKRGQGEARAENGCN